MPGDAQSIQLKRPRKNTDWVTAGETIGPCETLARYLPGLKDAPLGGDDDAGSLSGFEQPESDAASDKYTMETEQRLRLERLARKARGAAEAVRVAVQMGRTL
jgi:hypothetical protein